jgi:hypothetical protein
MQIAARIGIAQRRKKYQLREGAGQRIEDILQIPRDRFFAQHDGGEF